MRQMAVRMKAKHTFNQGCSSLGSRQNETSANRTGAARGLSRVWDVLRLMVVSVLLLVGMHSVSVAQTSVPAAKGGFFNFFGSGC